MRARALFSSSCSLSTCSTPARFSPSSVVRRRIRRSRSTSATEYRRVPPGDRPGRTPGGTRLYSDADVERLRLIQRLTTELGLNLAGVEHVLRLQDELNKARARMDRLERELREEIAEIHRSYKREVVLYRPARHPASRR